MNLNNFMKSEITRNGFTCPLNPAQIASWIVIAFNTIIFYCIQVPLSPSVIVLFIRHASSIIFGTFLIAIAITAYLATKLNPSDPHLFMSPEELCKQYTKPRKLKDEHKLDFCHLCQSFVGTESHHCTQCNRCVYKLDHHCIWMNNCIGYNNYMYCDKAGFFSL